MEEYYSTTKMDDQDETEETLSFCDLRIYSSDSADWESFSKEDQSLSSSSCSSSSYQDLFEFFSEEWSNSSTNKYPAQNMIVFCGKEIIFKEPATQNLERKNPQKPRKRLANKAAKGGGKKRFAVRKVWFLGSAAKWRWNLLACGLGVRLPAEMELSDIRSRQRRRGPPAPLFLGGGGGKEVGGGKGLWAMIRGLCGRHRTGGVAEGQFGCVPKG